MSPIATRFALLRGNSAFAGAWSGERPEGDAAARSYRYWRNNGYPATDALAAARRDADRGTNRPAWSFRNVAGARGERGGRWIENPGALGFRFVGWADELTSLDHGGWFTDDSESRIARAAVYQLPSRGGRVVYVEALHTGENTRSGFEDETGGALLFLDRSDLHYGRKGTRSTAERHDAARGADEEARIYAEGERENNEASNAGYRARGLIEDAHGIRAALRPALGELRAMRLAGVAAPTLCATLRRSIAADLRDAREKVEAARELWDEWATLDTWRLHLAESFKDGASASTFAALLKGKTA